MEPDLNDVLRVFGELGFSVEMIVPADDPQEAVVAGRGLRFGLARVTAPVFGGVAAVVTCPDLAAGLQTLHACGFATTTDRELQDVGGADRYFVVGHGMRLRVARGRVELDPSRPPVIPPAAPEFSVTRGTEAWHVGRAGMEYRDLIPNRYGGRFVASHIRIADGGPVPDYVHYHAIRFQLIYCFRGWVRLVYEDQGAPFVMRAGDCVVQPPRIRHRVLESSSGLEVIEVGCPAVHPTYGDPQLALPTAIVNADRDFDGQRFHWHRAGELAIGSLGVAQATSGLVETRVIGGSATRTHDAELYFGFVLRGELTLRCNESVDALTATDAFTIPAGLPFELAGSPDLALLEVTSR